MYGVIYLSCVVIKFNDFLRYISCFIGENKVWCGSLKYRSKYVSWKVEIKRLR